MKPGASIGPSPAVPQQEVFAIARKTLKDLANTSLETQLIEMFTRRLRELKDQPKAAFAEAIKTAPKSALVRTAFEMTKEQQAAIQDALNVTFSADIPLQFETAPELVGGIELTVGGQKLAWSIADYLVSLEKGVDELLKTKDRPDIEPEVKAAIGVKKQVGSQ